MFRRFVWVICFVGVLLAVFFGAVFYIGATKWHTQADIEVEIVQGSSVRKIADNLADHGVIRMPMLFEFMVRIKGVGSKLRAGTYEFKAGTTLMSALGKMERGEVKQYPFAIIEGWTIKDIAAALVGQPFLASSTVPDDFLRLSHDAKLMAKLGVGGVPSFEGYLFPDTYFVTKPTSADQLIRRFVLRFREVWNTFDAGVIRASGMTERQIITLASIVEKETGTAFERPAVASVFFNRLKLKMPLQSDPTIIYGLTDFDGNIRKQDITNPHLYNTYVHAGLPIGPICNPGKASLEAVLQPAQTNFLYFVSKNDGTHQFTETLAEHTAAVRQYQFAR